MFLKLLRKVGIAPVLTLVAVVNLLVVLTSNPAPAQTYTGNQFSDGQGHYACLCNPNNCVPCGNVQ